MRKTKGITLIALIITIIVLLIIAGISLGALTSNNSIIGKANKAKVETSIAEEKEILNVGIVQAMSKNKRADVTEENLQEELEEYATVDTIRKKLVVTFNESQRSYEVDPGGEAKEYEIINAKDLPIMDNTKFRNGISSNIGNGNVLSVTTLNKIDIPEGAISFDVSTKGDNGVQAWLVENSENEGKYDVYIGAEKGINIKNCNSMFKGYGNCVSIDLCNLYTDEVKDMGSMFYQCDNLRDLDISYLNVENATVAPSFRGCKYLKSIDLSGFNVMSGSLAFDGCSSLEELKLGEKTKICPADMTWTFRGCHKLKYLDTAKLDTSKVTDMGSLFQGCSSLESLDLSSWDTSKVTSMFRPGSTGVFTDCSNLKSLNLSNWDTSKVTTMRSLFQGCSSLETLDLSYFNTNKVDSMYRMLLGCNKLKTIYVGDGWDTSNVTSSGEMFKSCNQLVGDISFDSSVIDITYATATGGYLTYKSNN